MKFKIKILVLISHLCCSFSFSQQLSSIEGQIIDVDTKEPIVYASVYLAQTAIGVASNLDGSFKLENIPSGKYDLIVSFLGYGTVKRSVLLAGNVINNFNIQLKAKPKELETVTVVSKKIKNNKAYYQEFKKYFLGETPNASRCSILNRNDIITHYEKNALMAFAVKPIEIENKALGYKIIYDLEEFKVDYGTQKLYVAGKPRFIELIPKNQKQKARWIWERNRAYYGSSVHFFKSLNAGELEKNSYSIANKEGNAIKEKDLITDGFIKYKGSIYITFSGELSEMGAVNRREYQNSEIQLNGIPVAIYNNGYYEDFHNVILQGYFGWADRIADLLPLGYEPTTVLK